MISPYNFPYKKVLVIGAGGGNDIVSATLVALYLNSQGIETDVGGALSPGAVHTYQGNIESVVNSLEGDVRRYVPSRKPGEISFVDAHLPRLIQKHHLPIRKLYNFSIRFGTSALTAGVEDLAKKEGYECIVAVDVGGDILARGSEDQYVLSPMMDFAFLKGLSDCKVPSLLIEFGLGTDGELRPAGIREILDNLRKKSIILYESHISGKHNEVKKFRALFEDVRKIRSGHTAVMTLRTLDTPTPNQDIITDYRLSYRVKDRKWDVPFPITLLHDTFGKVYGIDLRLLAKERQNTVWSYENSLEQYICLRSFPTWKTEADLFYLWSGDSWRSPRLYDGICLQLLAFSTRIPEDVRGDIIATSMARMKEGEHDAALVYAHDLQFCQEAVLRNPIGRYALISSDVKHAAFLSHTVETIRKYEGRAFA